MPSYSPLAGLPFAGLHEPDQSGLCLKETLHLAFENTDDCCEQSPSSTDIVLNQVYRSRTYWNSATVLPCYGYSTSTWFYQQFHFYCSYEPTGSQQFHLLWCVSSATATRECVICDEFTSPPIFEEWDFEVGACSPLQQEFSLTGGNWSPCCLDSLPPMPTPTIECDLYATVTE